jgi:hypothetical protein
MHHGLKPHEVGVGRVDLVESSARSSRCSRADLGREVLVITA